MYEVTFEKFAVKGSFSEQPVRVLLDPCQTFCTISEDFVVTHSLAEETRAKAPHLLERFVLNTLSIPTFSGRYISTWTMSTRSLMDYDICLGLEWINACNIRSVDDSIADPSPSDFTTLPPTTFWQANCCSLNFGLPTYPSPALCRTGCSVTHAATKILAINVSKILIPQAIDEVHGGHQEMDPTRANPTRHTPMPRCVFRFPQFSIHVMRYDYNQPPRWPGSVNSPITTLKYLVAVSFKADDHPRPPSNLSKQEQLCVAEQLYSAIQSNAQSPHNHVFEVKPPPSLELLGSTVALYAGIISAMDTSQESSFKSNIERVIQLSLIYRQLECLTNDTADAPKSQRPRLAFSKYYTLHSIFAALNSVDWNVYLTKDMAEHSIDAGKKLYNLCKGFLLHPVPSFDYYSGLGSVRTVLELEYLTFMLVDRLQHYYQSFGSKRSTLDEAMELCVAVLSLPSIGGRLRYKIMLQSTNVLRTRYEAFNDLNDLEELIAISQDCVSLASDDDERGDAHRKLAAGLFWKAQFSGSQEDKELATHHLEASLNLLPDSAANFKTGMMAAARYFRSHDSFSSIDEVIELQRKVLDDKAFLDSRDIWSHPHQLSVLAQSLYDRFHTSQSPADGEEALQLADKALTIGMPTRDQRCHVLMIKAGLLIVPNMPFYDAQLSVAIMMEVVQDANCAAWERIATMQRYLQDISTDAKEAIREDDDTWTGLLHLTSCAARLLPRMVEPDDALDSRLRVLRSNQAEIFTLTAIGLAVGAFSRNGDYALQFVETGLALFWSRAMKTSLNSASFKWSEDFQRSIEYFTTVTEIGSSPLCELNSEAARAFREQYSGALIAEAEEMFAGEDPYSRFIHPIVPRMWRVLNDTVGNRLAIVLTSIDGICWAFLITGNSRYRQYPLEILESDVLKLSARWSKHRANARQIVRDGGSREEEQGINAAVGEGVHRAERKKPRTDEEAKKVLSILWHSVVLPLFELCDLKPAQTLKARPRQATIHKGRSVARTMSSLPTRQALISAHHAFKPVSRVQARILLGAAPRPFRGNRLPRTRDEVNEVSQAVPRGHILPLPEVDDVRVIGQPGISVATALAKLPEAHILHIASHGEPDPDKPLEGGFLLRDKKLKISQLIDMPLPNAFLAFLSACETAKGGEELATQAVHLAGTMMFTGFKSVVATLWSMDDTDGPDVAKTVYSKLFEGNSELIDPNIVPYAVDEAVRALRKKGVSAARWATYIHVGI